jgi:4-amino-4-deoxy-L-arabinose transferase-like glycosyltransferase
VRHRAFLLVAGAFVASAFVVPTLAPVSVSDDALYSRSVETLLRDGELEVLPLSAAFQVFQTAWGGLFGMIFGDSLGVFRVSTVALVLLGGWAAYGLCRELGVSTSRSALGACLYLFNPLSYVMSFTFMSDAPLAALVVISAYCYARGLAAGGEDGGWVVAGSVACAAALLVRQPGGLVAVAVAGFLVASRRVGPDRAGAAILARVLAVPLAALAVYLGWAYLLHGLPDDTAQSFVAGELSKSTSSALWIRRILFAEAVYPGFFVLPVGLAAVGSVVALARRTRVLGWLAVAAWAAVVIQGLTMGRTGVMPYLSSFVTRSGLGPAADLRGGRPPLFAVEAWGVLTVLCVAAVFVVLLTVCRRFSVPDSPERDRAILVIWVLALQALAVFATSIALRNDPAASRDRYLLPLLPLVVCLALWAVSRVRLVIPLAWLGAAAFAAFSVAGTHDMLALQAAAWDLGYRARADGVALERLDVGAGWAAYHRYQRGPVPGGAAAGPPGGLDGPSPLSKYDVPAWWTGFYQSGPVPDYVVATDELLGHTTLEREEYSSWLSTKPTYVYLVRRDESGGPP